MRALSIRPTASAVLALILPIALVGCEGRGGGGREAVAPSDAGALTTAWRWVAPPPNYVGMPGADGAGVAVTYGHSHVVLLDPAGQVVWTADRTSLRDVAPRLTPDAVLVATEEGVVAFDRTTGVQRWDAAVGERANTPVLAGATVVVSTWEGSVIGLHPESGSVAWRTGLGGLALGPPAAAGDLVVASWETDHGADAGVVALDATTGRPRWSVPVTPGGVSGPGIVDRPGRGAPTVVVVAGDGAAHGLAADSGVEHWRTEIGGSGSPEDLPLNVGDGTALVAHRLGGMAQLDAGDGSIRWEVSSDGAAVRGGPAGPGPGGRFALPLEDGRILLAGPEQPTAVVEPPGRASGVATGPGGLLLVGVREATDNDLTASTGW